MGGRRPTEKSRLPGSPQLRYLHEPRKGLPYGRNAGVTAARGTIVAFTDDDVEVYGSTETAASGPTTLGRLRAQAGRFPGIRRIVRPDVITRDWDLGVLGRCVGLRKIAEDQRAYHWDAEF